MSKKEKLKKLQLPKSSRLKTNSQISNFFSTSNHEETSPSLLSELPKTSFSQLLENSNENSTKSWTSEDIVLIVSDDEQDTAKLNKYEPSNSKRLINESLQDNIKQLPRKTVVSNFFNNSDNNDDSDFENPHVKIKPNKIRNPKTIKSKSISKTKNKKQASIKSAFVKNEEIFSELMAQHSIADNINPDELQMALAISISEATANGICEEEDSKEFLACSENSNKIRDRLQEYGFRTSSNNGDYDISYFLPGKKKTKWANKFTALTLRNPGRQKQKLDNQIEKFLKQQELLPDKSNFINKINENYLISSNYLNELKSENVSIKLEFDDCNSYCIEMFYVDKLFVPSAVETGHLMKDLNEIPGRDFSPKKTSQNKIGKNLCENIDTGNEGIWDEQSKIYKSNETTVENKYLSISDMPNSLESNDINVNLIEQQKKMTEERIIAVYESFDNQLDSEKISLSPQIKKARIENETENSSIKLYNEEIENRLSSPDLFADFETDILKENFKTKSKANITTFEDFSSDEVKASHDINHEIGETRFQKDYSNNKSAINITKTSLITTIVDDDLIDLTQDVENNRDSNSIFCNSQQKSFKEFKNDSSSLQSQLNSTQDDSIDDCIILSDDEVNYSIKMSNKTNYNKNIDLNLCSCGDTENEQENNYFNTENYHENNMTNFSFINLIEDNVNMNTTINSCINEKFNDNNKNMSYLEILEENENGEITPIQSSLEKQLSFTEKSPRKNTPNQYSKSIVSNLSFSEFLSPTKITPTKLYRNQSRFMQHVSPTETRTSNSTRKLNFNLAHDSLDSKSCERDSEDSGDTCFDLTKLRAKFGIKEINNKRKSINCRKTLSESCISSIKIHNDNDIQLKKISSSIKFKEFIDEDDEYFSDIDEIDQLVHDSQFKTSIFNKPKGIDKLLTADLKTKSSTSISKECMTNSIINGTEQPEEITSNGRSYLVFTRNIPEKPDYNRMDSPTRLKELYKYGLKPLKKKQAVIMLEYIYNQTHPIIVNNNSQQFIENFTEANHELINKHNNIINFEIEKNNENKFQLIDCIGSKLVADDGFIFGENKDEIFIFQTNISKKISTVLLPLHVAWYNLIKSNYKLKESILHYEPIDLQEIYLFFKRIGYRYDPKDIKRFFDKHCIIFRYDLNQYPNVNRHIRKKKSFTTSQKNLNWLL